MDSVASIRSIGQVARHLGRDLHRVEYVVKTRAIEPAQRIGRFRGFDEAGVEKIRATLEEIDSRRPSN